MPEIGQNISHYRILEKIGQGGMGEVYLADDTTLDRKVALKFLPEAFTSDPERMARFEREAKLLASLNHPNIAGIYGLEQADGNRFLVLEYVEGETLQARLSKGALPLEDALTLCRQIAEGLEAAHAKGVIHRDLKPANVMITAEEKVKILDFGLAKAFSDETQSIDSSQSPTLTEAMTRPGVILGTAAYMSPEQAKGKSVDKGADIWAFGCILYECLTGKRAFEGETVTETLAAVIKEEPDFNETPAKVQTLLRLCLAKDRQKRLRDIGDAMVWAEATPEIVKSIPLRQSRISWIVAIVFIVAFVYTSFIHFRKEPLIPFHPIRAQLTLPGCVKLAPGGFFSLSPDGSNLAFIGVDSEDKRSIWIHKLDSLEAPRPLPDTESQHAFPFIWSHDGKSIAFDAGNELKKIDIIGGAPTKICDLPSIMVGGSWNHEDVIILGIFGQDMMRVSVEEGNSSLLVKRDTQLATEVYMPTFLPNGRHFLYTGLNSPSGNVILIGDLNSKPDDQNPTPLVTNAANPVYIPARNSNLGYFLFLRAHTLMIQQFDEERLKTVGEAQVLAEQVKSFQNYFGFFSASIDGALIYLNGGAYQLIQGTLYDRYGEVLDVLKIEPGTYAGLDLSSDGKHAALSLSKSINILEPKIYLYNLKQDQFNLFTVGANDRRFPIWSYDGENIMYSLNVEDKWSLYRKPSGGLEEEEFLYGDNNHQFATSWSKDGRFVLCNTFDRSSNRSDLSVLDIKEKPYILTPLRQDPEYTEFEGHFSPDMNWIAYTSNRSGSAEVYVARFFPSSESGPPKLSAGRMISKKGGMGPRWSKDGNKLYLYYRSLVGNVMVVEFVEDDMSSLGDPKILFKAEPDLTPTSLIFNHPTWDVSIDGSQFLLVTPVKEASKYQFNAFFNWTSLLDQ